ncbi:MAG: MFS transporter [Thermoproteus sp. JCHS_4]|nr:MAG: MFS transporter [Thermoproteus sp. JCHS_4]
MIVSWFLFAVSSALTFPYLSEYMHLLGASDVDIGIATALGSLANMVAVLPGGVLTDVIGRRRSIVIGTWGVTATQFLYAAVVDWRMFVAVYVVDSAMHFYQPALTAILLDSLPPDRRGGGMMLTAVLPQVPWLFLPPVGGYLLDVMGIAGMRVSFLVSGAISAAVALFRMRSLTETVAVREVPLRDAPRMVAQSLAFWRGLGALDALSIYVLALGLVLNAASVPLQRFGVLYATGVLGLDNAAWGAIQSAATGIAMAFGLVMTPVIDRAPRATAMFSGLLLTAAGFLVAGLWRHVVALALAALTSGVGFEMVTAVRRAVIGDRVAQASRGRVMGASLALEYMGTVAGGLQAGLCTPRPPVSPFILAGFVVRASSLYLAPRFLRDLGLWGERGRPVP